MFCTKCGKEIADGSSYCPLCGQQFKSADPAPVKAPSDLGANLSSFFKDYFKNPVQAVATRAKDAFWLFGLISIGLYMLVHLLVILISDSGYFDDEKASIAFGSFFVDALCFGALIFGIFLFSGVFKLNKLSIPSVVSLTGLALLPLTPLYIIELIFGKILSNSDAGVSTFGPLLGLLNPTGFSSFIAIACIFAAIIIYTQIREASNDVAGIRSIMVVIISFACMLLLRNICESIQLKMVIDSMMN